MTKFIKIFHLIYVYFVKFTLLRIFKNFSKNRKYVESLFSKFQLVDERFIPVANYYFIKNFNFKEDEVIASFGIGSDIDFEIAMFKNFNSKSYIYDPTPRSKEFMTEFEERDEFIYSEKGLAVTNGKRSFYQIRPWSDYTINKPKIYFDNIEVDFINLDQVFKEISEKVIVLKLDIEGAALDIMIELFLSKKFENLKFVIVEFESPFFEKKEKFHEFKQKIEKLINILEISDYEYFRIPKNKKKEKFVTLELFIDLRNK
tara:strand:- start:202 stop:978 length:777 start_codon:yes stop_codon:yes gene_type:complete